MFQSNVGNGSSQGSKTLKLYSFMGTHCLAFSAILSATVVPYQLHIQIHRCRTDLVRLQDQTNPSLAGATLHRSDWLWARQEGQEGVRPLVKSFHFRFRSILSFGTLEFVQEPFIHSSTHNQHPVFSSVKLFQSQTCIVIKFRTKAILLHGLQKEG